MIINFFKKRNYYESGRQKSKDNRSGNARLYAEMVYVFVFLSVLNLKFAVTEKVIMSQKITVTL